MLNTFVILCLIPNAVLEVSAICALGKRRKIAVEILAAFDAYNNLAACLNGIRVARSICADDVCSKSRARQWLFVSSNVLETRLTCLG